MSHAMSPGLPAFSHARFTGKIGVLAAMNALLLASGCVTGIDDQRIATPEDRAVVDPTPTPRDFRGQNARHKVLVAVLDAGVDYNHPLLLQNMHFALDAGGMPVALGRDLIGDDVWPAPYVARTSRYDERLDERTRAASIAAWKTATRLVDAFPEMARFYHPSRNVEQELNRNVKHGTHVAGLMVYDRPDIGLLAYRVMPSNRVPKDEKPPGDAVDKLARETSAVIEAAVEDGARVINMSWEVPSNDTPEQQERLRTLAKRLRTTVLRHPRVLFVVAAGNSRVWVDGRTRVHYPCGIDASNVLCVGALRENGDLAAFSNIPLSGLDVVFTLGEDVLSTVPSGICPVKETDVLKKESPSDDELRALAEAAEARCGKSFFLERMSGTSMAAPIVAHVAAEILVDEPDLIAAEVVRAIYRRATRSFIGALPVFKLRIQKPSWVGLEPRSDEGDESVSGEAHTDGARGLEQDRPSAPEPGTWEAYLTR
ncbi:S8 family serine peptidase [Sorangium sp. So ce124]|uniref:S8 family serine peptidase n=1 Tax=Sorangium sp. So ce124 TaxID=3133280 RepID=UPI003F5E09DF